MRVSLIHRLFCWILRFGKIPKHAAFIMDGNRRFARSKKLPTPSDGHWEGFHRLRRVLSWAYALGIAEVSVYALSSENLSRSQSELDNIFKIISFAVEHSEDLLKVLHQLQVRVVVCGETEFLPEDVRGCLDQLALATSPYRKHRLNVCLAYCSTREIFKAAQQKKEASLLIESPVDLLIRTSGVNRLSDFLLWQSTKSPCCVAVFIRALWPDFGFFLFTFCILVYQSQFGQGKSKMV